MSRTKLTLPTPSVYRLEALNLNEGCYDDIGVFFSEEAALAYPLPEGYSTPVVSRLDLLDQPKVYTVSSADAQWEGEEETLWGIFTEKAAAEVVQAHLEEVLSDHLEVFVSDNYRLNEAAVPAGEGK